MAQTMTFVLEGRDRLSRVMDKAGDSAGNLTKKLSLVSTAAAGAATLGPLISQTGAAAVAVAAFGAAIGPQIAQLGEASEAQKKYEEAVAESGAASETAIKAEADRQRVLAKMPPTTREAAAALSVLKTEYRQWSDDLADDTMPVVVKSMGLFNGLLPKTTGMVKGTSVELDRLMTIAGGGMATPGFDRFMGKVESFAVGSLRKAVDGIVHLSRVGDSGKVGGSVREFMEFAERQGPLVLDTLENVALAGIHVLTAAAQSGVGLLQLANAVASVVASLPPGFIATVLQLAFAIKAVTLTHAGLQLVAGAASIARARIVAMGTAAIGASTTMGTLQAMFMTFSRTARMAMAATGIGLLVIGLIKLSSMGKSAPPDVDRLTTSLGNLARTGQVSGEAARAYGKDFGGLAESLRTMARPGNVDKVQQWLTSLIGMDSTPVKEAKQDLDGVDKALANLVKGGKADLAEAAFNRVAAAMRKQGMTTGELRKQLGDYRSAVADQQFEQQLAAQSMGLFGAQALKTQEALAAQKQSADGLRQSIQALNDVQRQGLGGMIGFEAAIDAAAAAARDNAGALSMSHGQLNLNSEKARNAATALNDLAARTDEATASARQSGASWSEVNGIYQRGRSELIKSAQAMGLTKKEAGQLADQILQIPDKTTILKGDAQDLAGKIDKAQAKVDALRQKRKTAVGADKADLDKKIAAAQAKVDSLRQKQAVAIRAKDMASGTARAIEAAIAKIRSKTVTLKTVRQTINIESTASRNAKNLAGFAGGGRPKKGEVAWVGENGPELMSFNGSERIYDHNTSMAMLDSGRLAGTAGGDAMAGAGKAAAEGLAAGLGGSAGLVGAAARRVAAAVPDGIRAELQIASPSKKTKALAQDVAKGFLEGLTGSRSKIKAVSADLAKDIKTAFSGKKEASLLRMLKEVTYKNDRQAKYRDMIAAKIKEAKAYANEVMNNARSGATLGNLGMEPDQVTAGGIQGAMNDKLSKIRQFTGYIKQLASRGLHKTLLRQILDMGPEAGYAYASVLAGADKSALSAINSAQHGLDTATRSLGEIGADRLYDAGKNAGKGFLKGLEGQQKAIEDLMMRIAKAMQKSIKKSLGIRSPSTVMAKLGAYSTEGLARGLVDGMPVLDSALAAVSGRVAATSPVLGRSAVVGRGGGGNTFHIHVDGAVVDKLGVARAVREALLDLKRNTGGGSLGLA